MTQNNFVDDLRQSFIVMKNEIFKFVAGKKFYVFCFAVFGALALITGALLWIGADDLDAYSIILTYINFAAFMLMIGATLFSSYSIVSEFEERTALIVFTRPIKKTSIFLGKFLASFMMVFVVIALYYVISAIISILVVGTIPTGMLSSFVLAITLCVSYTGVGLLFSSLFKKGSTAAIMCFVFFLIIESIMTTVIVLVTQGLTVTPDYSKVWYMLTPAQQSLAYVLNASYADAIRDGIVMLLWGIIPAVASWWFFTKREF